MNYFAQSMHVLLLLCRLFRYRPTLNVEFISSQLCFESVDQCVEFLSGCGAVLVDQGRTMDCKQSIGRLT